MDDKIEQLINDLEEFASDSDMNESGIYTEILDLIYRQKAEIERLTEENGWLSKECNKSTTEFVELQKQVDEFENRFENKACCNMSENCSMVQQAVKYTAKEILTELLDFVNGWFEGVENNDFGVEFNRISKDFAEKYGVEVEE